jgi:hypothetical protein
LDFAGALARRPAAGWVLSTLFLVNETAVKAALENPRRDFGKEAWYDRRWEQAWPIRPVTAIQRRHPERSSK